MWLGNDYGQEPTHASGYIAEIAMVLNNQSTSAERAAMQTYFANKYGASNLN
jgi:hypothetical protein